MFCVEASVVGVAVGVGWGLCWWGGGYVVMDVGCNGCGVQIIIICSVHSICYVHVNTKCVCDDIAYTKQQRTHPRIPCGS